MGAYTAGILGIGIHLPQAIRKNDWWSPEIVSKWTGRMTGGARDHERLATLAPSAGAVLAAMAEYATDPFRGGKERRVMDPKMSSADMEVLASEDALRRSGAPKSSIGAVMTYSQLVDSPGLPTGAKVHHQLGLPAKCFTLGTEAACNSFLMQLHLADQMIRSGAIESALLIQSSALQHLIRPEDEHSAWFGDGATAVVVGRVPEGEGLLSTAHETDGSFYKVLLAGHPGKAWHDCQAVRVYFGDLAASVRMTMSLPEFGRRLLADCFERSGVGPKDVNFFATHQGTVWFRKVAQAWAGMDRAKSFDSYPWTTSLGAANIPFMLGMAEREGQLRKGDLVAAYSGGSGIVVSGALLRWHQT